MKSLANRYNAANNSTHETFADLVFCALVVLVLFVIALAIEVSQRIRAKVPTAKATAVNVTTNEDRLTETINQLSTQVQMLTAELDSQIEKLASRDLRIQRLEGDIMEKAAQLETRSRESSLKEEQLCQLRAEISDQKAIAEKMKASLTKLQSSGPVRLRCQGWWEQVGFGRQPMKEFEIEIADGNLRGRGKDIIGAFVLRGRMAADEIVIQKTYFGRHTVTYQGRKHLEGEYHGKWSQPGFGSGPWYIHVRKIPNASDSVGGMNHLAKVN